MDTISSLINIIVISYISIFGLDYNDDIQNEEMKELDTFSDSRDEFLKKEAEIRRNMRIEEAERKEKASRSNENIMYVEATAYTANCKGCSGITATGIDVRHSTPNIIATDPRVIPMGTKVLINGEVYTAADTGGAIKGNKIDILMSDYNEAINFGRQNIPIKILN